MRIGEIKQMFGKVVDEAGNIKVESEQLYTGQAYVVKNYKNLIRVVEFLRNEDWVNIDSSSISPLIEKYGGDSEEIRIDQSEMTAMSEYIASFNQAYPYYYKILQSMVENQEEQLINIKLPEDLKSLKDLSEFNKRIGKIFQLFNIDGQFEFRGFDVGTNWYMVLAIGSISYQCLISAMKIATEYLKTKKEYFESKKAELDYKASLKNAKEFSRAGLKDYQEKRMDIELEDEVKNALERIFEDKDGVDHEKESKILNGVKELVKELSKGTEFHLSLNPPDYVEANGLSIQIDYKKINELNKAKEETKLLNDENKENEKTKLLNTENKENE